LLRIEQHETALGRYRHEIRALLMDDARMPVPTRAKRVSIARTTAIPRRRKKELSRVTGCGRIGMISAGGASLCRHFNRSSCSGGFVKVLQKMPDVETLRMVSSSVDYMLALRYHSTGELDRLPDRVGAIEGMPQTSASIILTRKIDRGPI
jgi:DNA-binding Lrp family transcriptional regulator